MQWGIWSRTWRGGCEKIWEPRARWGKGLILTWAEPWKVIPRMVSLEMLGKRLEKLSYTSFLGYIPNLAICLFTLVTWIQCLRQGELRDPTHFQLSPLQDLPESANRQIAWCIDSYQLLVDLVNVSVARWVARKSCWVVFTESEVSCYLLEIWFTKESTFMWLK